MKLSEKDLDKLITEVLNEKRLKIPIKFDDDKALVMGPPPTPEVKYTAPADKNAILKLATSHSPDSAITISDVKVLFSKLAYGNKSDTSRPTGLQLLKIMGVLKKWFEDSGEADDEEKKRWDATVRLMANQYASKMPIDDPKKLLTYLINPNRNSTTTDYKKNYAALQFDPKPAATTDNIGDNEDQEGIGRSGMLNVNLATYGSSLGQFPNSFLNAMNVAFAKDKNLYSRLQKITSFSEKMASPSPDEESSVKDLMANSVLLDYFTSLVTELDERTGAYQFEAFLAGLAGGKVEGAVADEDSGQMGAVDFVFAGGQRGSCKYYSDYSGIEQALSGFRSGQYVHYVSALKNKEEVSGTKKIVSLGLYYFKVLVTTTPKAKKKKLNIYAPNGARLTARPLTIPAGAKKVKLNKREYFSERTLIGTFRILGDSDTSYRETALEAAKKLNNTFGQALEKLSNVSKESELLNDNLQDYSTSGNSQAADESINNVDKIEMFTMELIKMLQGGDGYDPPKQSPLNENNQDLEQILLDKLIQEVILTK